MDSMTAAAEREGIPLADRSSGGWIARIAGSVPLVVAALVLLLAGGSSSALAGHDMGFGCYVCHRIRGGNVWVGSYAIDSGKPIGMPSYQRAITCDVCHTDYQAKFNNAV